MKNKILKVNNSLNMGTVKLKFQLMKTLKNSYKETMLVRKEEKEECLLFSLSKIKERAVSINQALFLSLTNKIL